MDAPESHDVMSEEMAHHTLSKCKAKLQPSYSKRSSLQIILNSDGLGGFGYNRISVHLKHFFTLTASGVAMNARAERPLTGNVVCCRTRVREGHCCPSGHEDKAGPGGLHGRADIQRRGRNTDGGEARVGWALSAGRR